MATVLVLRCGGDVGSPCRLGEEALTQRGHDVLPGALPAELRSGRDTQGFEPPHTNVPATATMLGVDLVTAGAQYRVSQRNVRITMATAMTSVAASTANSAQSVAPTVQA